jgi:Protein of unknown function (DUF1292)
MMMMMAQDMTEQNGSAMVEVVETTDENGVVHYFERIDEMEVDGQAYALLLYQGTEEDEAPEDGEEGYDEEFVLMKVIKDADGTPVYEYIEDEAEFNKVAAELEKKDYDFDIDELLAEEPGSQN